MAGYKVLVCLFPYGHVMDDRLAQWLFKVRQDLEQDKRIANYAVWSESETPITMSRNKALIDAEQYGADFVLMLDSDTIPDYHLKHNPNAKPFFKSSLDFALDLEARKGLPTVIAAPYCGPSPHSCCYVFDWCNYRNPGAQPDFSIEMVPRHEAALRTGIMPAAALPTGCILIDMRAVKPLPHPRFYYEWKDATASLKASTEDVVFTRDLSYVWQDKGQVIWCNWDAWAGHVKQEIVGKPWNYPSSWVPEYLMKQNIEARAAGLAPPPLARTETRVRSVNTYPAPPQGYPIELVRTRTAAADGQSVDIGELTPEELRGCEV